MICFLNRKEQCKLIAFPRHVWSSATTRGQCNIFHNFIIKFNTHAGPLVPSHSSAVFLNCVLPSHKVGQRKNITIRLQVLFLSLVPQTCCHVLVVRVIQHQRWSIQTLSSKSLLPLLPIILFLFSPLRTAVL